MNTSETSSFERTFRSTILLSLLIVLSTIGIFCRWTKHRQDRFRSHGTSLLLCGIFNSGKTRLFNRLTCQIEQKTSDSRTIHHGLMKLDYLSTDRPIKKVHVIDLPGNLRQYPIHTYRMTLKGIIFVIDSSTIENDIEEVSNYLDDILREQYFQKHRLPLLIFCNKQDLDKQHHSLRSIRELLERQSTVKRQRSSAFENFNRRNPEEIGRLGKETFEFDDVKHLRIEFAEGSVLNVGRQSVDKPDQNVHDGKSNLLRVHQWIARTWFT